MKIRKMSALVTSDDGIDYTVTVELLGQDEGKPARYEATIDKEAALCAGRTVIVKRWIVNACGHTEALNLALGWV